MLVKLNIFLINLRFHVSLLSQMEVEVANDIYKYETAKGNTRTKRETEQQQTVLTGASQNMLQPDAWRSFFNNFDNKTNIIDLLVAYLRSDRSIKRHRCFNLVSISVCKVQTNERMVHEN